MEQLRAFALTLMTRYIGSSHQPTPKCSHNLVLPLATSQKESERVESSVGMILQQGLQERVQGVSDL